MILDLSKDQDIDTAQSFLFNAVESGSTIEIVTKKPQRTLRQNKALHLCFTQIADQLTASGFDMKKTLKRDAEIMWTPDLVKEYLWRPMQEAVVGKHSTTELSSADINEVFKYLSRHLSTITGDTYEFPSIETLINKGR